MTAFLLNNKLVKTTAPAGMVLLDFIRREKGLKGTKSACREGDCGSCTVLLGALDDENNINYHAITSCITPLGNAHGKHVVTIEGLNNNEITPVQKVLIDAAATQCGYCTPGIVLSLTGYVLSNKEYTFDKAKDAVGGNICRCTGYKSIENAIEKLIARLNAENIGGDLNKLITGRYVPENFSKVKNVLKNIEPYKPTEKAAMVIGGGTDLYVQQPDKMIAIDPFLVSNDKMLTSITIDGNWCKVGAACKITDLLEHDAIQKAIPGFKQFMKLIASKLIRNIATIAGNLVNASPIGDLSVFFLALGAELRLESEERGVRKVKLKDFFKAYKTIDLQEGELVSSINFKLPDERTKFNFEKVSKRKYLDIATVNTAILIDLEDAKIKEINLSVGGVAPIPLYLKNTCEFLLGKELNEKTIMEAAEILNKEIAPISDVRGSVGYKRLLARQLFYAHFFELFPENFRGMEIMPTNF
jgi:xanthine dehydrogenase small subunit